MHKIRNDDIILCMHTPLNYQSTEFDAAPTAILNALRFLYERSELDSVLVKDIYSITLDIRNRNGNAVTSSAALQHICGYLSEQSDLLGMGLHTTLCLGPEVFIGPGSKLFEYLKCGGVAVNKVLLEGKLHYVTFTGISNESLYFFDPLFRFEGFGSSDVEIILDQPCKYNRRIPISVISERAQNAYLSPNLVNRELLLLRRVGRQSNNNQLN